RAAISRCRREGAASSTSFARDDVGFVEEPEAAVRLERLARGIDIASGAQFGGQPLVVDLRHVDGGIPGREQGGRADARGDLRRQRVHGIAKFRALIGIGIEVVMARVAPELGARRTQDVMTWGLEGVLPWPDL